MDFANFDTAVPRLDYFIYRNNTPNWKIEPSQTDFVDLTYVIGGSAVYFIDGQEYTVKEGDLLCIPCKSRRSATSHLASSFECFAANFRLYDETNVEVDVPLPLISTVGVHEGLASQFKRLNENWLRRRPGYIMRGRAFFMLILQRLSEMLLYEVDTHQFDKRVKAVIRFITDNYAEAISITDAAKTVHLTPNYLGILFKQETNVTFRDYLNNIRLNQAEDMLRAGEGSITEVAHKCGFKDVFYFSRLFKKYKGATPSSVQA
ncbi:MAG: AraC family transcriptional regulator [Defluviitaleaceae bacterium]|nr:AraC family transcriptional regulator [Defluviitaleaceae bacterium]